MITFLRRHSGMVSVAAFFGIKVALALVLLKLSATGLDPAGFALFSQFLLFSALLNLIASGGVQHGLVRQIAGSGAETVQARTAFRAAVEIWAVVSLAILLIIPFHGSVSVLLTGNAAAGWIVPFIVGAAVLNGLGQLFAATLIGTGKLTANAGAQAAGLVAGTAASAWLLGRGEAEQAAVAFALGSLATPLCAVLLARGCPAIGLGMTRGLGAERRWLLGYSGAFVVAASLMPAVLFALRYVYLEVFGVDALADWLVANRVSDVSTQLLGLFMAQWFLPGLAGTTVGAASLVLARKAFLVGTAAMLLFAGLFAAGSSIWIPLFISPEYLPAANFIALYMIGDALRVSASIALHGALARRRLFTYVGLEVVAATLLAAITLGLIVAGVREAPLFGYPATYLILTVALGAVFTRSAITAHRRSESDPDGR